jgi:hypothetical protein
MLQIGSKVRIKEDTEWDGIPFEAGAIATVTEIKLSDTAFVEMVWVRFDPEAAYAEFDADLLEEVR